MNVKNWENVWKNSSFLFINKLYGLFFWKNMLSLTNEIKINPKTEIIELGCGTGENLLNLRRKYDCKLTLVDNCREILTRTKMFYKKNRVKAKFLSDDVFKLKKRKKYDLVVSMGLIEHFNGKKILDMFKIHQRLVKKNGYVLIYVPNSSLLYRIIKKINEKRGAWLTPETPFTKKEILDLCRMSNLNPVKISKIIFGIWFSVLARN